MFNLKKNLQVGSLDDVPNDFKSLYSETEGGGYAIQESMTGIVDFIGDLQGTLARSRSFERDKKAELDRLRQFEALGHDPDSLKAHLDELNSKLEGASGSKEDLERFKEEYQSKHKALLEAKDQALLARDTSLAEMKKALDKNLIDSAATRALAKHGGNVKVLTPHIRSRTRVVQDERGEYMTQILDDNGDARFGATGLPMTIHDLVQELREDPDFAANFKSDAPSGSGSKPNGSSPRTPARGDMNSLSSEAKIMAGLEKRGRR